MIPRQRSEKPTRSRPFECSHRRPLRFIGARFVMARHKRFVLDLVGNGLGGPELPGGASSLVKLVKLDVCSAIRLRDMSESDKVRSKRTRLGVEEIQDDDGGNE